MKIVTDEGRNKIKTELAAAVLFTMNLKETFLKLYCILKHP